RRAGPRQPGRTGRTTRPLGRADDDRFLFGRHAVHAAILNPERMMRRLLCLEAESATVTALVAEARAAGLSRPDVEVVARDRLERLVPAGAVHQGVVAEVVPLAAYDLDDLAR